MTKKKTWKDWSSNPCLDCCVTFVLSLEKTSLPWVQSGTVALNIAFFFKDDDLKKKKAVFCSAYMHLSGRICSVISQSVPYFDKESLTGYYCVKKTPVLCL